MDVTRASLPSGLALRRLEPGDRQRVTAVVDQWWGRPLGDLIPRPFFTEFGNTSFVVEWHAELVAFLIGFLSQSNLNDAYIHAVAVAPAWRGRGLARILYQRFVEVTGSRGRRRVRAITSPLNATSIAFHRRLGFAIQVPPDIEGDDGRVQFVLEIPEPACVELDTASVAQAAAALRQTLAGTFVILEPLAPRHGCDLMEAAAGSDWAFMPLDASAPRAFERWFQWMLESNSSEEQRDPRAGFAVMRRRDGRAIGSTSFHALYPEHRRVEIGMTWYAQDAWGSGANVEAKLLMLERAFSLGFRRVEFKTDANNQRSRDALAALPATFEGILRKHMLVRSGERRDSAYYSIIDDDWPAVRANLERRLAR
jgi:N-acetyltransferase